MNKWFPHVTVAAVVERDGRFLMVQETSQGKTVINQPAGHLERDESLLEAVIRETAEETGWQFKPTALLGMFHFVADNGKTYLRFAYSGELIEAIANAEIDPAIDQVLWLTAEEIRAQHSKVRHSIVLDCIDQYQQGVAHELGLVQSLINQ